MHMTKDSFRLRLAAAITQADASGFTHFAQAMRELLRKELGQSVTVPDLTDVALTRVESPHRFPLAHVSDATWNANCASRRDCYSGGGWMER